MTRYLIPSLTLALALATSSASGQTRFGALAGINVSSVGDIGGSVAETLDRRTGFHAGVFADFGAPLVPVGLRASLVYVNTGRIFEGASFLTSDRFGLAYIAVPLDLRYKLTVLYLFAGPEFSYLLSSGAPDDFDAALKSFVMNWSGGLGVQLGPLLAEARFVLGLTGISEDQFDIGGVTVTTGDGNKATAIRLTAGFLF